MRYWKKILWNEFKIKVKTVSLDLFTERYVLYQCTNSSSGVCKWFYDEKLYTKQGIEKLVYKLRKEKYEKYE